MPEPGDFSRRADAMRTAHGQGRYADALALNEQLALDFPGQAANTSLWRLCLLSRLGRTEAALEAMSQALQQGLWWGRSALRDDEDLQPLQGLPAFEAMAAECRRRQDEAQKRAQPATRVRLPAAPPPYPLLLALHGRQSSAADELPRWEPAVGMGWMLAMVQGSQCSSPTGFCWDDAALAREQVAGQYRNLREQYAIDGERIVLGGFSQGGALAIQACLRGPVAARGFLAVAPGRAALEGLEGLARSARGLRGYLVAGGHDPRREVFSRVREALTRNGLPCELEEHPDLAHDFPPDFERSIRKALAFLSA